MFVVTADESETLCCSRCGDEFQSLERAWLASPVTGGEAFWTHKYCLEGTGPRPRAREVYRLRRGDFALRAIVQRLLFVPAI